jgi:hypothetical protein
MSVQWYVLHSLSAIVRSRSLRNLQEDDDHEEHNSSSSSGSNSRAAQRESVSAAAKDACSDLRLSRGSKHVC